MNPIQELEAELKQEFGASVELRLHEPAGKGRVWSLEVHRGQRRFFAEWQPGEPIGISEADEDAYGEGADELYQSVHAAKNRVIELVSRDGARTNRTHPIALSRLRELRRLTQQTVAERMDIRQPTLSAMERSNDHQVSSVARFVEALGGAMLVGAHFPDACYALRLWGQTSTPMHRCACGELGSSATLNLAEAVSYRDSFSCLVETGDFEEKAKVAASIREQGSVFWMLS